MNSASGDCVARSRYVQVAHRSIHVSECGQGHPLLLLHGGGPGASGLSNYGRNYQALARNFRVIVADMPGYGKSSKGISRSDPFGDLATSMLALLEALDCPQAHVVGNSLGGACGLRMALEAPERISALVLMGPGGINTTRSLPTKGLNLLLNYYAGKGPSREKITRFLREYLVYDGSTVSDAAIEERYQASIDAQVMAAPPLRRPNGLRSALRMDLTRDRRLRHLDTPTLVLWGADDKVNRPSGGMTLKCAMPNCDLYLFSRTGHWVQWERAEMFNAVVSSYLLQHSPSKAGHEN
ncbi:alpha/beta fold hydrolase [Herbaspirillum sp. NPDC087042]|uniref:alpha/beta fold hydrolase n=1 Tax=Herbaspirillum sp. NPDC087042 TaxID=3364004 RepID=UPI0038270748